MVVFNRLAFAVVLSGLANNGCAFAPPSGGCSRSFRCTRLPANTDFDDDWHSDYDGSKFDRFNDDHRRGARRPARKAPKAYLGPNGHDYQKTADSGPNKSRFTDDEVHELLATRLHAKFSKDFQFADKIQAELIHGGVFVHDGMKEYRVDGMPYDSFKNGVKRNKLDQQYSRSPYSEDPDGANDSLIDKLVRERTKFKMARDFTRADLVREGLRTKFNILIDDRLKQWSVGGDFGPEHRAAREMADKFSNRGYLKSKSSLDLEDEEEEYIQSHVDSRAKAKKDRQYETADKIRLDLAQRFDVTINDKLKLWSIGGVIEELGGRQGKPKGVYTRRGGGDLTAEEEETIVKMLSDRYQAKKQKQFDVADEMRDELMQTYNVRIDDRSAEWRIDTNEYAEAGANELTSEEREYVDAKLKVRFNLKRDRMYSEADAIRDELAERFSIRVDDRCKEWRVESEALV